MRLSIVVAVFVAAIAVPVSTWAQAINQSSLSGLEPSSDVRGNVEHLVFEFSTSDLENHGRTSTSPGVSNMAPQFLGEKYDTQLGQSPPDFTAKANGVAQVFCTQMGFKYGRTMEVAALQFRSEPDSQHQYRYRVKRLVCIK